MTTADKIATICVATTVIPMIIAAGAHAIAGSWRMATVFLCYGVANAALSMVRG